MKQRTVYLDYSATAPLRPQVREAMAPYLAEEFGNPSSMHAPGRAARVAVEHSRRRLARALDLSSGQLIFTGSGSEAANLAVLGFARRRAGGCVVRSSVEHKAVVEATKALAASGYDVRVARVDPTGTLDLAALEALMPDDGRPTLLALMWANNETGVVQPIAAAAELCRDRGATLFCDAVQAFGKREMRPGDLGIDLLALSAHKLGGPKGIGALVMSGNTELEPITYGGGQEVGLRSGTENVAGIVGFAEAADRALAEREAESARLAGLRDRLQAGLRQSLPGVLVNGGDAPERLPHVLNISIPEIDIEGLLTALDLEGVCVSSGSACTTGSVEPSHVLRAMGREGEVALNTVRLSLGWGTRADEIEHALEVFPRVTRRVRQYAARG